MECSESVNNETLALRGVDFGDMSASERRKHDLDYKIKEWNNTAEQIKALLESLSNPPIITGKATEAGPSGKGLSKQLYSKETKRMALQSGITIIDDKIPVLQLTRVVVTEAVVVTKVPVERKREEKEEIQKNRKNRDNQRRSKGKSSKPSDKADKKESKEPFQSQKHKEQKEGDNSMEYCINGTVETSAVGAVDFSTMLASKKKRTEQKSKQLVPYDKNEGKGLPKQPSSKEKIKLEFQGGKIIYDGKILAPVIRLTRVETKAAVASKAPVKRKREAGEEEETQKKRTIEDTKAQQHKDTTSKEDRSKGKSSKILSGKVDSKESKGPSKSPSKLSKNKEQEEGQNSKNCSSSNTVSKSKESTHGKSKDHSSALTNNAAKKDKRSRNERSREPSSDTVSKIKDANGRKSGSKDNDVKPLGMRVRSRPEPYEGASPLRAPFHNKDMLGSKGVRRDIGDVRQLPLNAPKTLNCVRRVPYPPRQHRRLKSPEPPAQSGDLLSGIFANFSAPNITLLPHVYDPR